MCEISDKDIDKKEESKESSDNTKEQEDVKESQCITKPEEGSTQEAVDLKESTIEKEKEWTTGDLKDESRRYCFDLSPKVS